MNNKYNNKKIENTAITEESLYSYFKEKTEIYIDDLINFLNDNNIRLSKTRINVLLKANISDYGQYLKTKKILIEREIPAYKLPIPVAYKLIKSIQNHGRPIEKNEPLQIIEKKQRGRPKK